MPRVHHVAAIRGKLKSDFNPAKVEERCFDVDHFAWHRLRLVAFASSITLAIRRDSYNSGLAKKAFELSQSASQI